MKAMKSKIDRLETALGEGHRARPVPVPGPGFRGRVMAEVRAASRPARAVPAPSENEFRLFWRLAPALAVAAVIMLILAWGSFSDVYEMLTFGMLGDPGSVFELTMLGL